MKIISIYLVLLFGVFFVIPGAEARGGRGGGGGRKVSAPRHQSAPRRSPMTGSKIERPQSRPQPKPVQRPQSRPETKPAARPEKPPAERPSVQRPSTRPAVVPDRKPADRLPDERPDINRPGDKPGGNRPDDRPSIDRPDRNKPATLPGMVTYPNRPDKGRPGDRVNIDKDRVNIDRDRVNIDRDKINVGDRNNIHIDKINVGRRNVGLNRPGTLPGRAHNWDNNKWGGNNGVWGNRVNIGNDVNINIDRRFSNNNNFSYRPNYWGARPWWGAGEYHDWHHGHWGYGWNSGYYHHHWWYDDDHFASGFMWGITVWSLGNMIYDMGYHTYHNPYPAPPVQNTYITYAEPISVAAAAHPPGDDAAVAAAEAKSEEALGRSRDAFKKGDYMTASKAIDEALAATPSDITLHEYRALVFFALGKYGDATGVLNPVLASGPGWSWDTMIGFYDSSSTYDAQLRKLESYVKSSASAADGHFLLGYHYMVCGHMEKAYGEFEKTARLQPADSIAIQLRDLTKNSIPDGGESDVTPEAAPPPVPGEKLVGTWVSDRGKDGKITFTMKESGDYSWSFKGTGTASELTGTYGLNDKGLLVLTSDDSQMVSAVTLGDAGQLHFVLIGAPDGDPGLDFTKG